MNKKILYIDDDDLLLDIFKNLLKKYNYDISTCSDSEQGLAMAISNNYDLIITDFNMKVLNGLDFIKRIIKVKPESIIFVLTGHVDIKIEEEIIKSGGLGVLEKPFNISKIISILENK